VLSRNEAERLAQAISCLRPEWPVASLLTFIGKRKNRPLLDLTIELAWVAQLEDTKSPARIDEAGPWKAAVRGAEPVNTSAVLGSIDFEADCAECLKPREHLWHGGTGTIHDHEFAARRDNQPTPRQETRA
jgi:hypothetical protein